MSDKKREKILQINGLCLGFGKKKVLDHIDVQFDKGETVLVAGNNGVGKTTFLRCIGNVYFPDSGTIRLAESIDKKKIGLISDKMSLFESFTLQEGIDFHSRVFNVDSYDDSLLKLLNINRNQKIKELSIGERAIYHLSLLFSQKPEILLVDEIIHAVDPYLRDIFLESLIELIDRLDATVIMVNHTFSEMGRIPERVLIMEDGRFIVDEKRDELDEKIKKVVTEKKMDFDDHIPVIFKKESSVYNEYYIYPFKEEFKSAYDYDFREVNLTEIVKSFIGGYYAKKRS